VAELDIDPDATRAGHGSRLLNAIVDTVRADGFRRVTVWVNSTDDVLRAFYNRGRLAPDGAHRELDLYGDGSVRVKQVRLHTDPARRIPTRQPEPGQPDKDSLKPGGSAPGRPGRGELRATVSAAADG
jgi:hypothetical protein